MATSGPKVIIAVDESPQAHAAFEYYFKFIHKPENEVIVTHCIEMPYVPYQHKTPFSRDSKAMRKEVLEDLLEKAKEQAKAVDDKYKQAFTDSGANGQFISEFGHAGHFIVDKAKELDANLIVMGTRGMGTIRRTILGSVTIGGDAIEVIFRNARQGVSSLEKKYTTLVEGRADKSKVICSMGGKPGEHLVHIIKEEKADMVVMGTRGLNKLRRTLVGSVSDYVVHHAHCPVIIYKG